MDVQTDFKDLLELFNARAVDYIIVGGYALAFHGAPRTTGAVPQSGVHSHIRTSST